MFTLIRPLGFATGVALSGSLGCSGQAPASTPAESPAQTIPTVSIPLAPPASASVPSLKTESPFKAPRIEPEEEKGPEDSEFVKKSLEDIGRSICSGHIATGMSPEIRGIIQADKIEALAVRYAFDTWSYHFNPPLNLEQSSKVVGISWNAGGGYVQNLQSTGGMQFKPGVLKNDDGIAWLLEQMRSSTLFTDLSVEWTAPKNQSGLKPDPNCKP